MLTCLSRPIWVPPPKLRTQSMGHSQTEMEEHQSLPLSLLLCQIPMPCHTLFWSRTEAKGGRTG